MAKNKNNNKQQGGLGNMVQKAAKNVKNAVMGDDQNQK